MSDNFQFRAMTYNLHLFGDAPGLVGDVVDFFSIFGIGKPLTYYDDQRLTEIIRAIRAESPLPDVIGLTEVWDKRFADRLVEKLSDLYPYSAVGSYVRSSDGAITFALPDFDILGAGLLLMSRHPFNGDPVFHPYMSESGFDAWAEKGVLAARIQVPGISATVGVLLTHLQADKDKADVRREQLSELASVAAHLRLSSPRMALLAMGDFNVIGEDSNGQQTDEYQYMIKKLELADTWRDKHSDDPGVTSDGKYNDLIKQFGGDNSQKRLDYIFYDSDPSYYVDCNPTLCKLLKYQSAKGIGRKNVRDLSDHYGLLAEYSVEVSPVGTITYHVDAHPDMPDIETPALRSLLAWMENAAIGYNRVDPAAEAPIIRVGFADSDDFWNGTPVIERLGRVHLNPRPILNNHDDPWRWGSGYDPKAHQLDLAYALQHFTGRALHSVSPRADSVKTPLDEQNSMPGSVMLPYQSKREFVDDKGQPDPDHLNHLTNSDIEYITMLYGRRTVLPDWRDKVQALHNNDLIKTILESGLTGTNGLVAQNIVRIDRQISDAQARIPINAGVYIHELYWCGGTSDKWPWENEEIRFILTVDDGTGRKQEYCSPENGHYSISREDPVRIPVSRNSYWMYSITSNFSLTLEVTELDSGLNGCNKHHRRHIRLADHGLNNAIERLRSLSGPTSITIRPPRISYPGKWWAKVSVILRTGSWNEVTPLYLQRTTEQQTLERLRGSFGRDLTMNLSNQLDQIWGGSQ